VLVARIHRSHIWHGEDGLDGILVVRNRTRDPAMDAEDIVIDHSGERKAIEALVDFFPNTFTQISAESSLQRRRRVGVRTGRGEGGGRVPCTDREKTSPCNDPPSH
jgi:hypothetical protein